MNDSSKQQHSYNGRVEYSEISGNLTQMVKSKVESKTDYNEIIKSFSFDDIRLFVCKFGDLGAEVISTSNLPKGSEFDKSSPFIAASFMAIIGQGDRYHEGLYGPLPIPIKGYLSIIFSKTFRDSNSTDPRLKRGNLVLFCILYPQEYSIVFYDRESLFNLFDTRTNEINDLSELSDGFVSDLRARICDKIIKLITPNEVEVEIIS